MDKLTIHACPLCQGTRLKHFLTCTDFYASGEKFEIWQCEHCGFKFTQHFPAESSIAKYYETTDYISHSDTKKGLVNALYHRIRKIMLCRKASLIKKATRESHKRKPQEKATGEPVKNLRLLDIGAGTGYFSHTMQEKGWQVEAVEKNAHAREFARKHFGLEMKNEKSLQEYPARSFDVITLWHVMEHLEHLNEIWEKIYDLLDDGGILIIAVPNSSSFDAQKYRDKWAAYDVPRHLWHFTPGTLCRFGKKHKFILSEQYPMPFDAFYISMLSEKYKKSSFPILKGMVIGTLAWLYSLVNKEKSSSIIYVFGKEKDDGKN